MPKVRLTRIMVCEYEPNPAFYPDAKSIEDMAALDASINDPGVMWSDNDNIIKDDTSWLIIGGDTKSQRQDVLEYQLKDLILLAEQHGMYDAADYLKNNLYVMKAKTQD